MSALSERSARHLKNDIILDLLTVVTVKRPVLSKVIVIQFKYFPASLSSGISLYIISNGTPAVAERSARHLIKDIILDLLTDVTVRRSVL